MRLFVGIDIPAELKQSLLKFQSELKLVGVEGLWKSPANFHLTLEFLGEVEPYIVTKLTESMSLVGRSKQPFNLSVGGLGAFPSMLRPHTLWTTVSESLHELHQLTNDIHAELLKIGLKLEEREFKPHITLASRPKLAGIDLSHFFGVKLGRFSVREIVLFESRSIKGKRVYVDLFRARLGKQK